jgi:hypothetical protein
MSTMTLRALLDARQNSAFAEGGVADIEVPMAEVDRRLAAMQRGLVAHDALKQRLQQVGVTPPDKLADAAWKAHELGLVGERERRNLLFFNREANRAKHDHALPF